MKSYVVIHTIHKDGKEVKEAVLWTTERSLAESYCEDVECFTACELNEPMLEVYLAHDGGFRCWHGGIPDAWKEL